MAAFGRAVLDLVVDRKGLEQGLKAAERTSTQRISAIGKRLSVSVTPAILGIGAAVLAATNTIDKAFGTIRTGTGATGKALEGLEKDFRAVFTTVPADAQTTATAIADLNTTLGLTGEPLRAAARAALELGRATGTDTAALISGTARAMQVFGEESADVVPIMDRLFVASQQTGIPIDSLTQSLQTYGPVLRNAGFATDEAAALLGQLHQSGVDASRVFPGLNAFLRKTAAEGVTDLKGALFDVVEEMENATTDADALNIATEAFGAEGAQRLVVAVREGAFELDGLIGTMAEADGAIIQNADNTRTLGETMEVMRNRLTSVLGGFSSLPGPVQVAGVAMGGLGAAMGPVLFALPQIVSGAKLAGGALGRMGGALPLGPVGLLTLGIAGAAGLTVALLKMRDNAEEVRAKLGEFERQLWDSRIAARETTASIDDALHLAIRGVGEEAAEASPKVAGLTENLGALTDQEVHDRILAIDRRLSVLGVHLSDTTGVLAVEIAAWRAELRELNSERAELANVTYERTYTAANNRISETLRTLTDNQRTRSLSDSAVARILRDVLVPAMDSQRIEAARLQQPIEGLALSNRNWALEILKVHRAGGDLAPLLAEIATAATTATAATEDATAATRDADTATRTYTRTIRDGAGSLDDWTASNEGVEERSRARAQALRDEAAAAAALADALAAADQRLTLIGLASQARYREALGLTARDLAAASSAFDQLASAERQALLEDAAELGVSHIQLLAQQIKAERDIAEQNLLTAASQDDLQAGIEGVTGARKDAVNEANLLAGAETALEIAQIAEGIAQGNLTEAKTAYNSALEEANRLTMDASATDEERATALGNLVIAAGNLTTAEGELATAIGRTADAAEDGTDRMISAWDRWRRNQNAVIVSMRENGITFDDIVLQMAANLGISTNQMADEMELLGINVGDTTALIEQYGEDNIGSFIDQIIAMKETTDAAAESLRALQSATNQQLRRAQRNSRGGTGSFLPVGEIGSGQEGYIASSSSAVPSVARDSQGNVRGRFIQTQSREEFDRILAEDDPTRIPVLVTGGTPGLASGGIVKARPGGTPVILGEGGRDELVTPLPSPLPILSPIRLDMPSMAPDRFALPTAGVRAGGGVGGGGITVNNNFEGDIYGYDDFEQRVGEAIIGSQLRGGQILLGPDLGIRSY